jgi:DNA-binding MarR family transcriptional regulator
MQARSSELTGLAETLFAAAAVLVGEFERAADAIGLTKQQAVVLRAVPATGTMAGLAAACRIDPSNLTSVIARLEQHGYAQRQPSAVDRRTRVVTLTAAGRRAVGTFERRLTAGTVLTTRLSDADRDLLHALLHRLTT